MAPKGQKMKLKNNLVEKFQAVQDDLNKQYDRTLGTL